MPTGTLVLPAVSDVRLGVQYGADGTEFTGTLFVPSDAAAGEFSFVNKLRDIVRQIPDIQDVTYYPRSSGDTYGTGVTFKARRSPLSRAEIEGKAYVYATWHLYSTTGQTVKPNRMGKIVDEDTNTWHVRMVTREFGNLKHDCETVAAVV